MKKACSDVKMTGKICAGFSFPFNWLLHYFTFLAYFFLGSDSFSWISLSILPP